VCVGGGDVTSPLLWVFGVCGVWGGGLFFLGVAAWVWVSTSELPCH